MSSGLGARSKGRLSILEREALVARFRALDADGSRTLSKDQLFEALKLTNLTRPQVDRMVSAAKPDRNGEIDLEQVLAMMETPSTGAKGGLLARLLRGGRRAKPDHTSGKDHLAVDALEDAERTRLEAEPDSDDDIHDDGDEPVLAEGSSPKTSTLHYPID